jgi:hypothetical protein
VVVGGNWVSCVCLLELCVCGKLWTLEKRQIGC